eukprot:499310-Amphidinium_carterae.1
MLATSGFMREKRQHRLRAPAPDLRIYSIFVELKLDRRSDRIWGKRLWGCSRMADTPGLEIPPHAYVLLGGPHLITHAI